MLQHWGCETVVLTRGEGHRDLAREMGASWVGDAAELPPATCDRAIVFAPAGELVPVALQVIRPGGTVSLAGIHMSTIPAFDYALLWRERSLRSVANMTRRDAQEFMELAADANIRVAFQTYPLEDANHALAAIAADDVRGAAVLQMTLSYARGVEAPGEGERLVGARVGPRPVVHHDGVLAGPEAGDLLARTRPERNHPELLDSVELVLGDLDAVELQDAGVLVVQVDLDVVDQAGELAVLRD